MLNLDESNKLMTLRHWHLETCSAVTGDGLEKGVDWLVNDIASRIFLLE